MYAKLFPSMYDGTLATDWQALVTFQQLCILKDQDGVVDMTIDALHRRTGIPREILEHGIEVLLQPDPHSRTAEAEGRRILPLDAHRAWGWVVVNHARYRAQTPDTKRAQTRERVARFRARQKAGNDV